MLSPVARYPNLSLFEPTREIAVEAVFSEPVSAASTPCFAGKYREIPLNPGLEIAIGHVFAVEFQ
jgi:hypothetical protein